MLLRFTQKYSRDYVRKLSFFYLAALLLDSIDFSQDPCEDFSKYACGKWIENHPIPDDHSDYTMFTDVEIRIEKRLRSTVQ